MDVRGRVTQEQLPRDVAVERTGMYLQRVLKNNQRLRIYMFDVKMSHVGNGRSDPDRGAKKIRPSFLVLIQFTPYVLVRVVMIHPGAFVIRNLFCP